MTGPRIQAHVWSKGAKANLTNPTKNPHIKAAQLTAMAYTNSKFEKLLESTGFAGIPSDRQSVHSRRESMKRILEQAASIHNVLFHVSDEITLQFHDAIPSPKIENYDRKSMSIVAKVVDTFFPGTDQAVNILKSAYSMADSVEKKRKLDDCDMMGDSLEGASGVANCDEMVGPVQKVVLFVSPMLVLKKGPGLKMESRVLVKARSVTSIAGWQGSGDGTLICIEHHSESE